jgi:hypothetical protein
VSAPEPPLRLAETAGLAGDCVRQVLAEQELAEPLPRFVALRERKRRRARRQLGAGLVGCAFIVLLGVRAWQKVDATPNISAELAASASDDTPAAASALPMPELHVADSALEPASRAETRSPAKPKQRVLRALAAPVRTGERGASAEAAPASVAETSGTAKACAQLASGGAAERALDCYEKLASGSGMTAELALFEQARLEGKVLHRPARALSKLSSYRQRFPNGSLRAEVMLAQIDWLVATGDTARALELVEEALASGLLHERGAELERLRARLKAQPASQPTP